MKGVQIKYEKWNLLQILHRHNAPVFSHSSPEHFCRAPRVWQLSRHPVVGLKKWIRAFADPLSIQTVFEVGMKQIAVPNLSQLFCPRYRRENIHWMPFCVPWPGILLRERKIFSTRQHLPLALWIPRIPVKSEKHQGFKIIISRAQCCHNYFARNLQHR